VELTRYRPQALASDSSYCSSVIKTGLAVEAGGSLACFLDDEGFEVAAGVGGTGTAKT
jgi:hypothetical protein